MGLPPASGSIDAHYLYGPYVFTGAQLVYDRVMCTLDCISTCVGSTLFGYDRDVCRHREADGRNTTGPTEPATRTAKAGMRDGARSGVQQLGLEQ